MKYVCYSIPKHTVRSRIQVITFKKLKREFLAFLLHTLLKCEAATNKYFHDLQIIYSINCFICKIVKKNVCCCFTS